MIRRLFAAWLLIMVAAVHAEERILDYGIDVHIQSNGSLDVTENIRVRAEGESIRRGIFRDFPTRYKDRYGNRVVVDLEVLGVLRDGVREPWFTEPLDNGARINTGNDDFLPVPHEYTYTIKYRTTRQLGFFRDHDELYWNAIGTGWDFPIEAGSVDVHLPAPVPIDQLRVEGYTGYQGEQGRAYAARVLEPGHARWQLTEALMPRQGFTLVLSFPKGVVIEPSALQRAGWLLKDNRGVLVALAGLGLLLTYCLREWRRVGRDPHQGIVIARYEPPAEQTPASLRYIQRMAYDARCFSAEVLALAVADRLRIERQKSLFSEEWTLHINSTSTAAGSPLKPAQQALLDHLFAGGKPSLQLNKSNAATLSAARLAHSAILEKDAHPRYFKRNSRSLATAAFIAIASMATAWWIAANMGIAALIVIGIVMAIALFVFARLVRAPTAEGRALLDVIAGLKLYLGVAERDELARMPGPDSPPLLDAGRYEMLLPYAVALEVEDAWTKKFTLAVGVAAAAAATSRIGWYHGSRFNDASGLSRALGSSLSSQIASSSSPPGSSSGGGGGGSSGGGGGGGGGGGR
ncbi:MAG: DUF2207 domain-containing protein [Pseudomonadales bacterium]|nr:DUF2207 domain-containing protein [Pseudomonadales bacterium]